MIAILIFALVAVLNSAFARVNGHSFNWLVGGFALGPLTGVVMEKVVR